MKGRELLLRSGTSLGLGHRRSAAALDALLGGVAEALREGRSVSIVGFGVWEWKEVGAREAHNPKTLRPLELPPRRKLVFKPSEALRQFVQRGR